MANKYMALFKNEGDPSWVHSIMTNSMFVFGVKFIVASYRYTIVDVQIRK